MLALVEAASFCDCDFVMFGSVCRCVCLDQPGKPVKYLCRSLTVKKRLVGALFSVCSSRHEAIGDTHVGQFVQFCGIVLHGGRGTPFAPSVNVYQPMHGGEMMCLFSHARTRLRGADREGTCSCEGAEFLWWCEVGLGKALYLIFHLKGTSVTFLARVRHWWLHSMW